jgi:hypothetical protein
MRVFAALLTTLLASSSLAQAEDVLFNGTVLPSCSILGHTNGSLAVDLANDGKVLTSEVAPGAPATVTVLSVGSNFINVAAPTRTAQPLAYVPGSETREVSYSGAGLLSSIDQDWTAVGTSHAASAVVATAITLDNRINNVLGFPAGPYQTTTVVTCSSTAAF